MVSSELSERRSLSVIGMSASALCYEPACDHNCALKEKIIALTQRHRRYGPGMIYLKLRQAGEIVSRKRGNRLYAQAGLQVKTQAQEDPHIRAPSLGTPDSYQPGAGHGLFF